MEKTMTAHLEGKNILITGATDGIGKQGALELAAMGASLILVGRMEARCKQTVEEVINFSGNDRVNYLLADLSSMAQVAALAEEVVSRWTHLDVLVNNAGAGFAVRSETLDGFERTFALNHLAYFLLTNRLLDLVEATPGSRIISTSSGSSFRGKIHFNDLQLKRGYGVLKAYAQSKLANVMFTYSLARRLAGKPVTANCFHPGLVKTGVFRKVPIVGGLVEWWVYRKAISVEEGTETLVYLASSDEVAGSSGHYYYRKQPQVTNPISYDLEAQDKLWEVSEAMVRPWLRV
jgi:NAD(P)-dependent dehydrogenase (short-subunit alcohol dehydrogenase family)